MYCVRCGTQLAEHAAFCHSCGASARPDADGSTTADLPFFPVATHKFVVLSMCSFGLYEVYWCYQNWHRVKSATGEDLSPFWRAFFTPLWVFSLFGRVRTRAIAEELPVAWRAGALGTLYFVLSACSRLPQPWSLITFAKVIPILLVQQTTQCVNGLHQSSEDGNRRYTAVNMVWIVCGGLLLVLAVIGSFME